MMTNLWKMTLALMLILPVNLFGIDWQTLGLYRSSYHEYRASSFNPDGIAVDQIGLKNTSYYFSQYLDLTAKFLSFNWQFDVLGASAHEKKWDHSLKVKQLYFQRDLFQNLDIMVGRSLMRWGTGYAYNPTDVVAPQKELSDPDNDEKRAAGNDLVKLEYFGETYSVALTYLTKLTLDKKLSSSGSKLALRLYKNMWGFDFSLVSLSNRDEKPIVGGNVSYVIGERLEIHGEIATQKGSYQNYHRAIIDENTLYLEDPVQPFKQTDGRFYNQYLVGINYTLFHNINWILEYYHQDQGYSRREWKRVVDYVRFLKAYLDTPFGELVKGNLLWSLNVFSSKGAMRDYLMNYITIPVSQNVELKSTSLINLNDGSYVLIPEIGLTFRNHFTFYGSGNIFGGNQKSEFGELFRSFSIEGGVRFSL